MASSQDHDTTIGSWLPKIFRHNSVKAKDVKDTPDEQTSLLPPSIEREDQATGEVEIIESDVKVEVRLVAHEFWILFKGSIPVILAYTLQNSLQTISVLIVGRLGAEELAVSAFCYSECANEVHRCGSY